MIAQHVLNVHKNASAALDTEEEDRKVCLTSHICVAMEMYKAAYGKTVMDSCHIRTAYSVCWHPGLAEVLMDKMLVMRDLQTGPLYCQSCQYSILLVLLHRHKDVVSAVLLHWQCDFYTSPLGYVVQLQPAAEPKSCMMPQHGLAAPACSSCASSTALVVVHAMAQCDSCNAGGRVPEAIPGVLQSEVLTPTHSPGCCKPVHRLCGNPTRGALPLCAFYFATILGSPAPNPQLMYTLQSCHLNPLQPAALGYTAVYSLFLYEVGTDPLAVKKCTEAHCLS